MVASAEPRLLLFEPAAPESATPGMLQRLESALLVARGAVWEWHVASRTVTLGDGYYQLLGLNPALAAGQPDFWATRVHPDDIAGLRRSARASVRAPDEIFEREYRLLHADGRWLWVLDRGRVTTRDAAGRAVVVSGMLVEITQRRTAEAALRESEERFRLATEVANGLIYDGVLHNGRGMAMRYGIERMTGYAQHELDPSFEGWLAIVHEDDRAMLCDTVYRSRKHGTPYDVEYRLRARDGRLLYVWHRGVFVHDANGNLVRGFGFIEDITARVEVQQALQASEFRFRAVAELTAGYVFETRTQPDGTHRMVFASDSFHDVMAGKPEEFAARGGWESFLDARSQQIYWKACERIGAGLRTDVELCGTNLRGEEKWLRLRSSPVYDPLTGRCIGSIGATTDITETKRAELELRKSRSVLLTIAEGSAAQLALFDLVGRCIFVNRSLVGCDPQEMVGMSIEDVVAPDPRASAREIFADVVATGKDADLERMFVIPATGEVRAIELRLRPVLSGTQVVAVVTSITDVTEARRQQEELQLQARIIETLREGVAVLDEKGFIRLSNSAFDRMHGYAVGELLGHFGGELSPLPPTLLQKFCERIQEQLDMHGVEPLEIERLRKDGSRFIASCGYERIVVGGERHLVIVLSDVTEHKQMEREILQIANREQQRIGSDLHDGLGQDLTGVALLLRGLAARLARAEDAGLRAELVPDVEQIIGLVNDTIYSTRALARGLSPVSAQRDGLVMGLETLVSQTFDRYGVRISLRPDLADVLSGNPVIDDNAATHLYRIAQEAVTNAVRHGKATRITICLRAWADAIDLSIHDNGAGFIERAAPGVGMGLKIMRYRARMIGATLQIDSVPGAGTTVRCQNERGSV